MRRAFLLLAGLLAGGIGPVNEAQSLRITPQVAVELRAFAGEPLFSDQLETLQSGLILTGDLRWTSADRKTRVLVEPYIRLDSEDSERTYADLREASVSWRRGDWDILFGISQVFWGVAESRNVVDVINNFDTVEDFDEGEKLGQPMVRVSRRLGSGSLEAFYLPYFRERRFPGREGRLRFGATVDEDAATFERSGDEWAGDFALRWSSRLGDFDLGLHAFHGTSRNPLLLPGPDDLIPHYQELTQGGFDLQYTRGSWLWKLEAAAVSVGGDDFVATVGGFEYTFFGLAGRGLDLGIIGEYLYDNRDITRAPLTLFENDAFIGARLTFNDTQDTEILAGAIIDSETSAILASVEFQRRLGTSMLLEVEARWFDEGEDTFVAALGRDNHLTLRWTSYF